eukprot:gnl/TRDRNA2_/TRDRNA2_182766_c0_seq1.p1 gnl/TRDRNA2_/TRDRNA2_182766_c0~~gnl/TRDRNA2_/TRDRNA2_182766_c0_seq1.p1  ORF type:complete len:430 (+),score=116.07 gnl/TRDRNA2_/TRDRNA2_182766_c0_seq1:70-1290(+)
MACSAVGTSTACAGKEEQQLEVEVAWLSGEQALSLMLASSSSLLDVKQAVEAELPAAPPAVQQHLLHGNRKLADGETLAALQTSSGPVQLQLVVCAPGLEHVDRLSNADLHERVAAARALQEIGEPAAQHAPALQACLKDTAWQVREAAADALGTMMPAVCADDEAVSSHAAALAELLAQDRDWRVRRAAAHALTAGGAAAAAPSVAVLSAALRDPQRRVRQAASLALGVAGAKAGAAAAVEILNLSDAAAVRDPEDAANSRILAARSLGAMGEAAASFAADALAARLQDPAEAHAVRVAVAEALAQFGEPAAAHSAVALAAQLVNEEAELRHAPWELQPSKGVLKQAVVWALSSMCSAAVSQLSSVVHAENQPAAAREAAAAGLKVLGQPSGPARIASGSALEAR